MHYSSFDYYSTHFIRLHYVRPFLAHSSTAYLSSSSFYHRFVHFDWKTGNNNRHTHTHNMFRLETKKNSILTEHYPNCLRIFFSRISFFSLRKMPRSILRLSTFQANSSRFIIRTSDTSYLTRARSRNSHYLFVARAHSSGVK